MTRDDEGARRGLMEEVRMIGEWGRRGTMRQTRHFLVDFDDALTAADLAHWRVRAEEQYPRLPVPGDYAEQLDHLAPVTRDAAGRLVRDNSRPCVSSPPTGLRTWDWLPLARRSPTPAGGAICVDVRNPRSASPPGRVLAGHGLERAGP